MTDKSIRINDLKDVTLQKLAQKHDIDGDKGTLSGQEVLAFNNELKSLGIVTNISDLKVLKQPQKVISGKNVITVIENYSKNHKDTTLFGVFMKDDTFSRDERKKGLLATFEIFYNAVFSTATTNAQKAELEKLKKEFTLSVEDELQNSWFEWGVSETKVNEIVGTMLKIHTASSQELAGEIFDYIDDTSFSFGDREFSYLLDSVNEGNVISVAQKIKEHPANTGKESMLKILAQEYTAPFDEDESNDKKIRIKTFVEDYFKAAKYYDTPYMNEAKKLLNSIINSTDTGSNILTSDIEALDSLMDAVITNKPEDIASRLYTLYDNNSYALDRPDVRVLLDKINASNVQDIMLEFVQKGDKKSLLTMIDEEWVDDKNPKDHIKRIVLAQLDASGMAQNKIISGHVNNALVNEDVSDIEDLMKIVTVKNPDVELMAKTLHKQLVDDENNVNKEVVKYILNSINKDNVVELLSKFEKISGKTSLVEYLQDDGGELAQKYITQIVDKLVEVNSEQFKDEQFNITFGVLPKDIKKYVEDNIDDEEDITRLVKSFLPATPHEIVKNIKDIGADKTGAADDITFKLWVAKINSVNVDLVIDEYKKQYSDKTPINAIIEERGAEKSTRQALVLHILSSVVHKVGEDKIPPDLITKFTDKLEDELFGWGLAGASGLNTILNDILKIKVPEQKEIATFNADNVKLTNVRVDVPELKLGKKVGLYSWEYEKLQHIKTLEDVAEFTGLRVEFLKEMIKFEGYKDTAYTCSSGKRTIGIGHNFHSASKNEKDYLEANSLTDTQINQIFAYDLTKAIHNLVEVKKIDTYELTSGEYEALVDLAFNAPGYMNNLTDKTLEGVRLRKEGKNLDAARVFEEATLEFNQQFSNGSIMPGLCKRRIQNVLRYMDVDNFAGLTSYPNARKRVIVLALNGYKHSSFLRQADYQKDVCEMLNITPEEFMSLEMP